MKKIVVTVHYNTPELTEAAILSVRKHGGKDYEVVVFDNSDKRPFTKQMQGVRVIDNTKGQIIDFDKELAKYPERDEEYGCAPGCVFGSDKHMMSVQKLWDLVPDGFVLMDSDILVKQSFDFMFMPDECAVGHVAYCNGISTSRERLAPMLLFINVPLCKQRGATFFDPDRAWALHHGDDPRNFWDTGAAFLADIRTHKNGLNGKLVNIKPLIEHYVSGSWNGNTLEDHQAWLAKHRDLWYEPPKPNYTVLTYIFGNYEIVQEVVEKDPEAEYLLITDNKDLRSDTWQVVYDPMPEKSVMHKCYYVRFHPFQYAHTNTVVRIDGSIEMRKPLTPLIEAFEAGGYDRCMMIHPTRNNFAEELDVWCKTRDYSLKVAGRTLYMMQHWGYNLNYKGMFQGCFEIVRDNNTNREINALTYSLMLYTGGSDIDRLDQHITSFVINSQFAGRINILPVSELLITDGNLMQWYLHHTKTPIPKKVAIRPYMFNKVCKPWNEETPKGKFVGKPETAFCRNSRNQNLKVYGCTKKRNQNY